MQANTIKRIFLCALLSLLCACSFNDVAIIDTRYISDQPKKITTYVYDCPNATHFIVSIEGRMAWIFLPEQTLSLPKISSASGVKYSDGQSTFWSKGKTASFTRGTTKYKNCVNNPGKAIWEHAKLNGVDFRAVGNEPGWHLEIMQDNELIYTGQYGQVTHTSSTSERHTDPATRKTEYTAAEKGHTLSVTILGESCHDTMSGESFASTVTVVLDNKVFNGCGRALH